MFNIIKIFFVVGALSFGGGYAIIPILESQLISSELLSSDELFSALTLGSMLPGSVLVNIATLIGFQIGGILLAFFCVICVISSSFVYMSVGFPFMRFIPTNRWLNSIFYCLRATVVSLILYASYILFLKLEIHSINTSTIIQLLLIILSFTLLMMKQSTIKVLIISGVLGVIFLS
ncbi:chromate transporter [Ureibacillus xyleni]|uniref:Chromate transporter n=1 Tax=Ureibacillus xyleni TaxID=614648 RepID=A0A285RXE4_9BACL|nr:chromate transporter [Ureibacillus xyleni]SOB98845.1 chromate transporter [Ureibacillus xyleni]